MHRTRIQEFQRDSFCLHVGKSLLQQVTGIWLGICDPSPSLVLSWQGDMKELLRAATLEPGALLPPHTRALAPEICLL